MYSGFETNDMTAGRAAAIVYAVYRSADKGRKPTGVDMWGQIERFCRSSAKRAEDIGQFMQAFKRKMGCDTINPRYTKIDEIPMPNEQGEIIVINKRTFLQEITELGTYEQRSVVDMLYANTTRIILLVRARLENEKMIIVKEDSESE